MPELQSRDQNLDGHVVIIDPSFDGNPTPIWDVPTLEQVKASNRLATWEARKTDLTNNNKSLARELRFKTSLAFLQPFIETGVALGIYADRMVRLFS